LTGNSDTAIFSMRCPSRIRSFTSFSLLLGMFGLYARAPSDFNQSEMILPTVLHINTRIANQLIFVVYVLRWIAGRHAGVAEFNPPYIVVS
jgi:hypothetical protein